MIEYDTNTVSNTVVPLSTDNERGIFAIKKAIITVEDAELRFRVDGGNPDADTGHKLYPGDICVLEGEEIPNFRAIRAGTADATLRISLTYKY
jgi:hypothetical protein